jgi:hypothetical protein
MPIKDKTIQKLMGADGRPLLCQHFVRKPGVCMTCHSTDIGAQCTARAMYPDQRCCQHTAWLQGTWQERSAADNVNGRVLQETARWRAWHMHSAIKLDTCRKP